MADRSSTSAAKLYPSMRLLRYFGERTVAEAEWSRGMIQDMPRSSIPVGGVFDATDFLLDQPGLARKRGGTSYQGSAMGANTAASPMVAAPEFPTGTKVISLAADGHVYDVTTGATDAGALGISTVDTPKLYVDKLIVPASDGTTSPKKITAPGGTVTIASLGGSPPAGKYVTIYASRPVIGNSAANPNRAIFGPVPNIESTWDVNSYIDFDHSLTGLGAVQGVMLGFSGGFTERVIGGVPPDITGENMSRQVIGSVGCCDARSIANWGGYIVFAGQDGVYVTNGAGFDGVMEKSDGSGILSYWRALYASAVAGSASICGGIYSRNYYHLSVVKSDGTLLDYLICYLPRKAWMRATNIKATMFASSATGSDELYCSTNTNRVLKLSGIYVPSGTNKNDADGTAVTPVLKLRMMGEGISPKRYGHGHVTLDMRDAATDNPTMTVKVATGIEADSGYANVQEGATIAETTKSTRKRFVVNKESQAANLSFTQTNASSKTEIYAVELDQSSPVLFSNAEGS